MVKKKVVRMKWCKRKGMYRRHLKRVKFWECPRCDSTYIFYHERRDVFYCGNCGMFFTATRIVHEENMKGGDKNDSK